MSARQATRPRLTSPSTTIVMGRFGSGAPRRRLRACSDARRAATDWTPSGKLAATCSLGARAGESQHGCRRHLMRCRRLGLEGRQCGLVGCYDGVRGSGRLAREELLGPTHRWWQGSGPGRGELLLSARCDAAISVTASILAANRPSGSGRTGPIVRTAPMRTGRWVRRSRNWHRKSASAARRTQFVRRPADPLTHRKPCRRPRARDGVSHPNSLVFEYRRSGLGGDRERIAVSRPGRQVSRSLV